MATQFTGSGDVPLARQLLTADCEMPIAAASLPTPPHKSIALSSGLMQPIISQVIANVNTAVIGLTGNITYVNETMAPASLEAAFLWATKALLQKTITQVLTQSIT